MALGALETSPTNLAQPFAPFANGGYAITPYLITSITKNERVMDIPLEESQRVISEGVSFLMKEALTEVAKGGQLHACVIDRRPLAEKPVRPTEIATPGSRQLCQTSSP